MCVLILPMYLPSYRLYTTADIRALLLPIYIRILMLPICVSIYIYIYTHTHEYMYTHTHTHTHTHAGHGQQTGLLGRSVTSHASVSESAIETKGAAPRTAK